MLAVTSRNRSRLPLETRPSEEPVSPAFLETHCAGVLEGLRRMIAWLEPDQRAHLIEETRLELDELTNLVSELVDLATDMRSDEPVEGIDLDDVVEGVVARYRRRSGRERRTSSWPRAMRSSFPQWPGRRSSPR